MEARRMRAALAAAILLVSMGARHRSTNFIVDTPDAKFAAQMADAAEKYRHDLAIEWTGQALPNWSQPCPMTVQVGPNLGAGGATTFVFDQGEVFGWRMTIQGSAERLLDSVLPHEVTHMIFASHFRRPLPRWADEGGATSVEHISERMKHRQMLVQFLHTGRGIAFNKMFAMKEYPQDVMPLYAQGYSLAEFLIEIGGRRKFVDFIGDVVNGKEGNDWSAAVRRHYGVADVGQLQVTWLAWVQQGSPLLKPRQEHPAPLPAGQLAATGRPQRPEPNLVYHVRDKEPTATPLGPLVAISSATSRGVAPADFVSPARELPPIEHLAIAAPRTPPVSLPANGWHAPGTPAPPVPPVVAASAAEPTVSDPFRAQVQVTHPQPIEQPKQTILEWGHN
jgi:hypothetical protein